MPIEAPPQILLGNRLVTAATARVSVFDRGFQYGDALIETVRIDRGRCVALDAHLRRLTGSAQALGIPLAERAWQRDLERVIAANGLGAVEAWARITVTRGVAARGLLPPAAAECTVIVAAGALDPAIATQRRRGISAITLEFGRGTALAGHKHAFYLPSIEGKRQAAAAGADDGLFCGPHGGIESGTTANVFAVLDEVLVTPRGGGVLPGITRARVLALAREQGWRLAERKLRRGETAVASEVFLTNALFEVVPVVRLDGRPVGAGRPGVRARTLQRALLGGVDPR
jgi:branched-subunit amino acid aminotransferase/4-amino-4-deoxychorismate lyase